MPKRVLVAESSAVIRGVAETLLRQNGYEVLSVGNYEKALEVLSFTRPDLLVIGGDLANSSGQKLYEQIQRDGKTASVPMLLFRNPEDTSLPFPDEVLVPRPFESRDFIEKVQVFCGQGGQTPARETVNPLNTSALDDEFLDAALGLDRLDVTHSEVMNKTSGIKQPMKQPALDPLVGMGHQEAEMNQSRPVKVESLMIKEDASSISARNAAQGKPGGTSKIEIVDDQYGMVDPKAFQPQVKENHDYNWFVNEMKQEANNQSTGKSATASFGSSGGIKTTTAPVTPAVQPAPIAASGKGRTVGVEKFIDEFKREIEKFRSDDPEAIPPDGPNSQSGTKQAAATNIMWEETVERLNPEAVTLFTRQVAAELAEKIAQKIVSKIDPDKLLVLIKNELIEQAKKKQ